MVLKFVSLMPTIGIDVLESARITATVTTLLDVVVVVRYSLLYVSTAGAAPMVRRALATSTALVLVIRIGPLILLITIATSTALAHRW